MLIVKILYANKCLNLFTGLRLNISDGLLVDESYDFSPDKCDMRSSGRIVCASDDRVTKVTFKPARAGGERAFKIVMKDRALPPTVVGPIDLFMGDALAERNGTAATCADKTTKVICRE